MYYSSVNCTFELFSDKSPNGIIIAEAYSIRVNSSRAVMPYYSWSNRNVRKFVKGTILVEGALILNVNSTGYLKSLVEGTATSELPNQDLINAIEGELTTISTLLDARIVNTNSNPTNINLEISQDDMIELAKAKYKVMKAQQKENITPSTLDEDSSFMDSECDIRIYEGSSNKKLREHISGLVFTGKSYEITAGSSMNIKYAFPFVAKKASI